MKKKLDLKNSVVIILKYILILILVSLRLEAWDGHCFFQHKILNKNDGLPKSSVTAITQTPDGYIWMAAGSYLVQFDGVNFTSYNYENTPAIKTQVFIGLEVDNNGILWIATRGDGLIKYKNRQFRLFTEEDGLLSNEVWAVKASPDNSVWIGTRKGLNRYNEGKIYEIHLPENLGNRFIRTLFEDHDGCLWAGTMGGGLVKVIKGSNGFKSEVVGFQGMDILSIFEDRKGVLWIGTLSHGLFKIEGDKISGFSTAEGLTDISIKCIHKDRFDTLWIGTHGGGIHLLPEGHKQFVLFNHQNEYSSKDICCFFKDRERTLWVGTNGGGVICLREAKIDTYTTAHGLSHNNIYGVFQDSKGRMWVGTKGWGANFLENNYFYNLTKQDGLSSDMVVSFAEDRNGYVWLGTLGGGVARYREGKIDFFDTRHGLSLNFFRCIYADPQGNIWAATIKGDIHRFSEKQKRFIKIADLKFRVNTLLKDSRGNLWAGTFGRGLCLLKDDGKVEVFDRRHGLSHPIILCIHEGQEGDLWIGTCCGLNLFRRGKFRSLYKKDGLPDNTSYWILEDHKHDFWISSNQGIYCLYRQQIDDFFKGNINSVHPLVFGIEDGMRSLECNGGNYPGGWKSDDGRLWFPTTQGVSVIDPKDLGINKILPPVIIKKIEINGKSYSVKPEIKAPAGENDLKIYYTALSFIAPNKIRFKYKLDGFDYHWKDCKNIRIADYPKLPFRDYHFRVIACNSDGIWNSVGTSISLKLTPKFYQTFIFKILLLCLGIFFLFWFIFFTGKEIKRSKIFSKNKCKKLIFDPEETEKYVQKLLYLVEIEKLYSDPFISLKKLSSRLIITPRNLSHIINIKLKTNFHSFITNYRIKEAQRILRDFKSKDKSILEIAGEVGYYSKSAFNRAFKEVSFMTPSQYRKKFGK